MTDKRPGMLARDHFGNRLVPPTLGKCAVCGKPCSVEYCDECVPPAPEVGKGIDDHLMGQWRVDRKSHRQS